MSSKEKIIEFLKKALEKVEIFSEKFTIFLGDFFTNFGKYMAIFARFVCKYSVIAGQAIAKYSVIAGKAIAKYSVISGKAIAKYSVIAGRAIAKYSVITAIAIKKYSIITAIAIKKYSIITAIAIKKYTIITAKAIKKYTIITAKAIKKYTILTYITIRNFFLKYELARLVAVLFIITSVTAFLLGTVNAITAPIIQENKALSTNLALIELIPDATNFTHEEIPEASDDIVLEYYKAFKATNLVGYCVKVAPMGFGGPIEMIVAFDKDGVVLGTEIISYSETKGLGTKIETETSFAEQFIGKSEFLKIIKGFATTENEIVAISGATFSSSAMNLGVNTAIAFIAVNK